MVRQFSTMETSQKYFGQYSKIYIHFLGIASHRVSVHRFYASEHDTTASRIQAPLSSSVEGVRLSIWLARRRHVSAICTRMGSVQSLSHIWFGLSGARHWLKR